MRRPRREWTEDEVYTLCMMRCHDRLTVDECARRLDRSVDVVQNKLRELDLTGENGPGRASRKK